MSVTITDVAMLAGVSTATVSRVLSGGASVLPETRERVDRAVELLNYTPSGVARSLRSRRTRVIGLIVTDITNPFYPDLVRGLEDAVHVQGRSVLFCNAAENVEREQRYLDVLSEQRVDAMVVASSGLTRRWAERLDDFPIPVVLVNVQSPGERFPAVVADNQVGGRIAAEHLLEQGYGPIVHIAGTLEEGETSLRQAGVADVAGDDFLVAAGDGHLEGGARAMLEIAESIDPPFGVVAHNDLSAIGAMSALHQLGWDVPGQVGVVGFDDIDVTRYVTPPLTSVVQDRYGMGAYAADLVHRLLDGESVSGTHLMPVELAVRQSTSGPE